MKLQACLQKFVCRSIFSGVSTVAALALVCGSAMAHEHGVGQSKILTLKLKNFKSGMRELVENGYDIAGADPVNGLVDIVQRASSHQSFDKEIFQSVVSTKSIDTSLAPDVGYKTPDEVTEIVQRLANNYPDVVTLESVGQTQEGRDIWGIRLTSSVQQEAGKPVIFLNALHHAREVMTVEVALDAAEYLASRYESDSQVRDWLDRAEIWIVPMVNPDGSNMVWTRDSMWRKNTSGSDGVDVNRNYPYRWNQCNGSSGSPYSDTYRGPSAGSENETKTIMSLVERIRPVFSISFHSYSELVLYPYSCDGERVPQREVVEGSGRTMAGLLRKDSGSGTYTPGTSWEILYAVDGGDIDWMYNTHNVIPYVIELNGTSQGFQPSFSRWRNSTVTKTRAAWQYVINRALSSGVRGRVTSAAKTPVVDAVVQVKSATKDSDPGQMIKVTADGTFHAVLVPGAYTVRVASGDQIVEKNILVGGELVTMDLML